MQSRHSHKTPPANPHRTAVALGATVHVISHSPNKKDDAHKLGAHNFISSKDPDWHKPYAFTFDFILNCADGERDTPHPILRFYANVAC